MSTALYRKRIKKVLALLKKDSPGACLILSSASPKIRSADTYFPYVQDKNFYYLTGSNEPDMLLFISNKFKTPILFSSPADKKKILWEGPRYDLELAVRNSGAELVESKNIIADALSVLKETDSVFYQTNDDSLSYKLFKKISALPSHQKGKLPSKFKHADNLLGPLRIIKDPEEIGLIKKAIDITFNSWCLSLPLVMKGASESLIAATIEYAFRTQDADYSFQSIIASGKNASVLHYHKLQSKLNQGDLLLFDIGASYKGYSADISRTIPVSKKFSAEQSILYKIVLNAQKAAIKKIKHGVLIKEVHHAACAAIIEGLVKNKLLKGKTKDLLKKSAHLAYFPHGIGHSLGLDVHDIGNHRGNEQAKLEKGMVFTVEPGIYLPKTFGKFKACGIRIEDDVLVTSKGCQILSDFIPKEPEDIEELMSSF